MPPRRRTAAPDNLPADLPFSPGQKSAELFASRKQHATSLALSSLASSPDLAQWGNELHGRVRRWQNAFTAAAILLGITVSALGYQTAVYHSGHSLTVPFIESFDKLSSNSQQAMQQLVSHGSKLLPEGSSIRDSFDKLGGNTQQALYHLANSGLSLPSLLPQKHAPEADSSTVSVAADNKAAKAQITKLTADLRQAEKENAMVSDLLQHSQHELSVTQGRTHELLASIARLEDERALLSNQNKQMQAALDQVPESKDCLQQQCDVCEEAPVQSCPPCAATGEASELYGTFGSQKWLVAALGAANLAFIAFVFSPEAVTRPLKTLFRASKPAKDALHQVSRKVSDTSASYTTDSTFSRNTSSGQDSLLEMQQRWNDCIEPAPGLSGAITSMSNGISSKQKVSPQKASPVKISPTKGSPAKSSPNGLSAPSTPRTHESESVESEADMRQQIQALTSLAEQRDQLSEDLKATKADSAKSGDKLAETLAYLESVQADLAHETKHSEGLQSQVRLAQDRVAEARAATAAADVELQSAQQKVVELTNNLSAAKVEHEKAVAEVQQQHADAKQVLEVQLARLTSEKDTAEVSLEQSTSALASIKQELTDTLSLKETAEALLEQTRADLKQHKQRLAEAALARDAATASLEQVQADAKQQSQALSEATAARASVEASIKQLQVVAKRQAQELADAVSAKEFADTALEQALADAEQQGQVMTDAVADKESAEATIQQLTAELQSQDQAYAEAAAAKQTVETTLKKVRADAEEQAQALATAVSGNKAAESALKQARAHADQQEQALKDALSAKQSAESTLEKTKASAEQQEQAIADAISSKQSVKADLEQAAADAEQQEQALTEAKESAEAMLGQARAELKQQSQALADVTAARQDLEAQLKQAQADAEQQLQELSAATSAQQSAETSIQHLKAAAAEQKQALADAVAARDAAQAAVDKVTADAERKEQSLADANTGKGSLEDALQQARAECSRLSKELKGLTTARSGAEQESEERNKEVRRLRDELDATSKECTKMQMTINSFEDSVSALQGNLDQSSQENSQLSDELEHLESEHEQLHAELDALEQQSQSASHKLKQVSSELSDFKQQATAEYDSLRAQNRDEVEFLQDRAHQLQRQLQSSHAQVQALQDQLQKSHTYIHALENQLGAGLQQDGRMSNGQSLRSPKPVRTASLSGSMRSPRSPSGSSTSSGTSSRARGNGDFQTQLTDAQARICELETEVAACKLEVSLRPQVHPTPAPCPRCSGMEPAYREVLSQVSGRDSTFSKFLWKLPGEYHNVRSSAFASLCAGSPSKGTASPSTNLSSHAPGQGTELSSHAVNGPTDVDSHAVEGVDDVDSHAIDSDQALPSHALELEEIPRFALGGVLDSPQSSVGSAAGQTSPINADMHLDLHKLNRVSPRVASPWDSLAHTPHPASGRDTSRTPLSSHAVPAGSTDSDSRVNDGMTPLSSHAVHPSSSSGSGTDEDFAPTPEHDAGLYL